MGNLRSLRRSSALHRSQHERKRRRMARALRRYGHRLSDTALAGAKDAYNAVASLVREDLKRKEPGGDPAQDVTTPREKGAST